MNKKASAIIGLIIGIYILATSVSYALFSKPSPKKQVISTTPIVNNGGVKFDDNLPKTEACPLNGELYSTQQRDWWQKHRPLGVMIENHLDARPQSGLSSADVVYEAVAEGGITRFLSVFYCQDGGIIGPVRSARTYFVDFISEYGDYPLYAHVGGANTPGPANALGQIEDYGWKLYNNLDQIYDGDLAFPIFVRDYARLRKPSGEEPATEHTMYSSTAKLWQVAKDKKELTNVDKDGNSWDEKFVPYDFKDDVISSGRPANASIHLEFWDGYGQFFVDWTYDPKTNLYKRNNGGIPHLDKDNNKQLISKNIAVLFMQESNANDGYENNLHLLYRTKGTGKALVFMDGKKTIGTWRKDSRTSRTLLFDENGSGIKFNRGKIWFEILPLDGKVVEK